MSGADTRVLTAALVPQTAALLATALDEDPAYEDLEARAAGDDPYHHVHMMAVRPELQGQGIGGALLRDVLRDVDASAPVVLTTHKPENVVFYRRADFEVVHEGRLVDGWKLPRSGPNFAAYSDTGRALGRTYVHSRVHAIVLESYAALDKSDPELRLLYGETGPREGGPFEPHRTHQTGTSVDFMTPVRDGRGAPAVLPTGPHNKFGYGIDFDRQARFEDLRIDFEATALHLALLAKTAAAHDDNYHVDFGVRCARTRSRSSG